MYHSRYEHVMFVGSLVGIHFNSTKFQQRITNVQSWISKLELSLYSSS
jgi:hypothetical protein